MKSLFAILALAASMAAQTQVGPRIYTGAQDWHSAAKTLPHRVGAGSPVARDACAAESSTEKRAWWSR